MSVCVREKERDRCVCVRERQVCVCVRLTGVWPSIDCSASVWSVREAAV